MAAVVEVFAAVAIAVVARAAAAAARRAAGFGQLRSGEELVPVPIIMMLSGCYPRRDTDEERLGISSVMGLLC